MRATKDVPSASGKRAKPTKQELDTAVALIEAMGADWKPEKYEDCHRKRLQKIVNQKRKGKKIEVPEDGDAQPDAPPDLMAVLKEALAAATK